LCRLHTTAYLLKVTDKRMEAAGKQKKLCPCQWHAHPEPVQGLRRVSLLLGRPFATSEGLQTPSGMPEGV